MKLSLDKFKTPAEMHTLIDLRPEQNRYVMQLKYKGRVTFLRLFDDQIVFPTETETAAALKRLMQAKMPKIAFVQGELERSIDKMGDRHYKTLTNSITFRYSLVNQGFDVETVSLKDQEIPTDIAALVIADPKVAFDMAVLGKIQRYIAAGGNLLIAGEPGKQAILNPILQPLGVHLLDGMLVQKSRDFSPELVLPFLTTFGANLTRKLQGDAEDSLPVSVRGASALSYDNNGLFAVTPLLMTNEKSSWNKKVRPNADEIETSENTDGAVTAMGGGVMVASVSDKKKPAIPEITYSPADGDQNGPLPAVLGLTRMINGKQQRIVVAGDADFLSNSELGRYSPRTCNFDFSTALFSWFSYGEFPIDSSRPKSKDNSLELTSAGLTFLKILLLGILPGLLLIGGAILLIRRKSK
jgi:ABC-2 type transport system permease protein